MTWINYHPSEPLAKLLGRDPPSYGARYEFAPPRWRSEKPTWNCRSCPASAPSVTDRYRHELDFHRGPLFAELAALEATLVALFGPGPSPVPARASRDGSDDRA